MRKTKKPIKNIVAFTRQIGRNETSGNEELAAYVEAEKIKPHSRRNLMLETHRKLHLLEVWIENTRNTELLTGNEKQRIQNFENTLRTLQEPLEFIGCTLESEKQTEPGKHAKKTVKKAYSKLRKARTQHVYSMAREKLAEKADSWQDTEKILYEKILVWCENFCTNQNPVDRQDHYSALETIVTYKEKLPSKGACLLLGRPSTRSRHVTNTDLQIQSIKPVQKNGETQRNTLSLIPANAVEHLCRTNIKASIELERVNLNMLQTPEKLQTALQLYSENPNSAFEQYLKLRTNIKRREAVYREATKNLYKQNFTVFR